MTGRGLDQVPAPLGEGDGVAAHAPVRRLLLLAALMCGAATITAAAQTSAPAPGAGPLADITYLASPELNGRGFGTPGSDSAAVFLARRYQTLGIPPIVRLECSTPPCGLTYYMPFTAGRRRGFNVVAVVPGSDSTVRQQIVVVGAHYDGQGIALPRGARENDEERVHPSADDNASGTAAVLALAVQLAADPPRRTVLLVHFGGEEEDLLGSKAFWLAPPVDTMHIVAMINFDMVGRLNGGPMQLDLTWTGEELRTLTDSVFDAAKVAHVWRRLDGSASDHESFGRSGVPSLHLSSGTHRDYHRPTDLADRIDVAGLTHVVTATELLVRALADNQHVPPPEPPSPCPGFPSMECAAGPKRGTPTTRPTPPRGFPRPPGSPVPH